MEVAEPGSTDQPETTDRNGPEVNRVAGSNAIGPGFAGGVVVVDEVDELVDELADGPGVRGGLLGFAELAPGPSRRRPRQGSTARHHRGGRPWRPR